jgi:hypothetical protein
MVHYLVRELAARSPLSPDSNVIINVMTPGACKSDLLRDEIPAKAFVQAVLYFVIGARSTAVGGGTLTDAVRPDLENEKHGAYLMDCKVFP